MRALRTRMTVRSGHVQARVAAVVSRRRQQRRSEASHELAQLLKLSIARAENQLFDVVDGRVVERRRRGLLHALSHDWVASVQS